MSVTLKAVDCAAKSCGSTPVDFAAHVVLERGKLESLRCSFLTICHELRAGKEIAANRLSLLETVVAIFTNLYSTSEQAFDSVFHGAAPGPGDSCPRLQNLRLLGGSLTRSVRLCVVSLCKGEAIYAAGALREVEEGSKFFEDSEARRRVDHSNHCRQHWPERAIAANFENMTKSLHRVATLLIEAEQAAAAMLSRSRESAIFLSKQGISGALCGDGHRSMLRSIFTPV